MPMTQSPPIQTPTVETIVAQDPAALAGNAAHWLIDALADATRAGAQRLRVCLSGGSTPKRLYELLARPEWAARLPWERIEWYFGDDRFLPHDNPDSNAHMAREALFNHVPAPHGNLHVIPYGPDLQASADAYDTLLRQAALADERENNGRPLFDAMICGLGLDGHTASLFPGKPELMVHDRLVVAVPEAGQSPFVPRISLTLPALNNSRFTAFLVAGADKRDILARVRRQAELGTSATLPAARITARDGLVWLLDRAAAPADDEAANPAATGMH